MVNGTVLCPHIMNLERRITQEPGASLFEKYPSRGRTKAASQYANMNAGHIRSASPVYDVDALELVANQAAMALEKARFQLQLADQTRRPLSGHEEGKGQSKDNIVTQEELEHELTTLRTMSPQQLREEIMLDNLASDHWSEQSDELPRMNLERNRSSQFAGHSLEKLASRGPYSLPNLDPAEFHKPELSGDASTGSGSSDENGRISLGNTPMARALGRTMSKRQKRLKEVNTPFLDHYSHKVCWYTQQLFTIATFVLLFFSLFHKDKAKFVRTFFVISTAALAYYAKCSGLGEVAIFDNKHVPIVRYVDWVLTTPIMLSELCHIGHAADETYDMIIGCDLLMLSCGIASALIPGRTHMKEKYVYFIAGGVFFAIMVFTLHRDVANGTAKLQSSHIQSLFRQLEILTVAAWSVYPVACGLGRAHAGLISVPAEDTLICFLDIVAKIGMEGFIIYSVLTEPTAVSAVNMIVANATSTLMVATGH